MEEITTGRLKSMASIEDVGKIFEARQSEPTKLFEVGSAERPRIAVSMRDAGETNVLLPVVKKLADEEAFSFSIFADGQGAKLLADWNGVQENKKPGDILVKVANEINCAEMVLVSQSSDSGIDMALAATAKENGKPVMAIEDFPGSVAVQDEGVVSNYSSLLSPTWYCTINKESKDVLLKLRPGLDTNNIFITGSPAFDNLDLKVKEKVRNQFRLRYEIGEDEKIIVWMGQTGEANNKSLELLIDSLQDLGLNDYRLVVRKHPRDENGDKFYEEITRSLSNHMLDTKDDKTEDVRRSADMVVTMFSTEGLKSVYEQTPTILIMIPELLKLSGYDKFALPFSDDGSVVIVKKEQFIKKAVSDVLQNENFRKNLAIKMKKWQVDGKATERISDLIKSLLGNK